MCVCVCVYIFIYVCICVSMYIFHTILGQWWLTWTVSGEAQEQRDYSMKVLVRRCCSPSIYIYILYIYLIFHFPDFISHFTSMDHFVFPLMTYQIEILADKCVVLPCLLVCFYLCLLLCVYFITQHTYRDREEGHTSSQERDSD